MFLSESERYELEPLAKRPSTPQQTAWRARIILHAADGESHGAIARALGIDKTMSRRWRPRWRDLSGREFSVTGCLSQWHPAPLDARANHRTVGLSQCAAGTVWPSDESLDTRQTGR
ncbi:MAG: helix-turn-helix domain-containing protein [Leptolyngbya sp. SIOISBB]|nr:helix-turn-helix domain-containing protein [Leptolyngbya sp. SIOISBB]